jgi:hypothetical protein
VVVMEEGGMVVMGLLRASLECIRAVNHGF